MRNYFKEVGDGYRNALKMDVVKEPRWRSRTNMSFVDWATSQIQPDESVKYQKGYEVPDQNPLTQRYFENTRGPVIYSEAAPNPGYYIEVAKRAVPNGSIGVVKGIGQYFVYTTIEATLVYTINALWGDPFVLERSYDFQPRWHFRLENYEGADPVWMTAPIVGNLLPGEAHPDLAYTDGLSYPWSAPSSQNIHLLIPGGKRLRVIVEIPAAIGEENQVDIEVAGVIRGFTLGDYGYHTLAAIRAHW